MRVVRIDRRRVSKRVLRQVIAVLRAGGVVAYPTETSYGLAADPADRAAVGRIFAIKGRERGKPLPLIAASFAQAAAFVRLSGKIKKLARRHWPGPLTLVAPLKSGKGTAAIRVPASLWARALARSFGRPVTSTSANLSGRPACYSGRQVARVFRRRKAKPDIVLDAGVLPRRPPSTIVRVRRGKIEVLREGAVIVK